MNIPNEEIQFSAKDVKNMVESIDDLFAKTSILFNANQFSNHPESIVAKEEKDYPKQMETTLSIATVSMESAADHFAAFSDLLKEPVKPLAPYTCVRSLMEMSALACWLLDPAIDSKERLSRTFARRYVELTEQQKLFNVTKDKVKLESICKRIEKVETDALTLGFAEVRNKKGERDGIARRYPSIVELIDSTFGKEFDYRLLSGIAHGHMWAMQQTGFKLVEHDFNDGNKIKALTKELVPNIAIYFGMVAVVCFSRLLFSLWTIFGWDKDEIVHLLEATFDSLGYSVAIRFWRNATG